MLQFDVQALIVICDVMEVLKISFRMHFAMFTLYVHDTMVKKCKAWRLVQMYCSVVTSCMHGHAMASIKLLPC